MIIYESYELYNISSRTYDKLYREEQYSKYDFVYEDYILPSINTKSTVLDMGCGTGLLLEYVSEKKKSFYRYVCIEPSSGMLSHFVEKGVWRDPRILVIQGLWESTPLRDNSIDYLYAFTVIDNVSNREQAIWETLRVLKERGSAIISFIKRKLKTKDIIHTIARGQKKVKFVEIGCNKHDCFIYLTKINT